MAVQTVLDSTRSTSFESWVSLTWCLSHRYEKVLSRRISGASADFTKLVVVGDQSAGKSSVLESLTGFTFPRSVTLCTRHATEIICRREEGAGVTVSIVPHNADLER